MIAAFGGSDIRVADYATYGHGRALGLCLEALEGRLPLGAPLTREKPRIKRTLMVRAFVVSEGANNGANIGPGLGSTTKTTPAPTGGLAKPGFLTPGLDLEAADPQNRCTSL